MIFRSEFYAEQILDKDIEHDHRHISRVISICWKSLVEEERQHYFRRAAEEKAQHKLMYPDYRFRPTCRKGPVQRRNVKRNGTKDKQRCETLAKLITEGKKGNELKDAIKAFDAAMCLGVEVNDETHEKYKVTVFEAEKPAAMRSSARPASIFRSPLLPQPPPQTSSDVPSEFLTFDRAVDQRPKMVDEQDPFTCQVRGLVAIFRHDPDNYAVLPNDACTAACVRYIVRGLPKRAFVPQPTRRSLLGTFIAPILSPLRSHLVQSM
jgi:hypothetical protein